MEVNSVSDLIADYAEFVESRVYIIPPKFPRNSSSKSIRKSAIKDKIEKKLKKTDKKVRQFYAIGRKKACLKENKGNCDKKWIRQYGFTVVKEFRHNKLDNKGKIFKRDYQGLVTDIDSDEDSPGQSLFHVR
jgi:hypothetical protein